jgi:hypothetical protein
MRLLLPLALALSASALTAQVPPLVLTTNFFGVNANNGVYFDIIATNAAGVNIEFFEANLQDTSPYDLAIYKATVPGPYAAIGSTPSAWTLVGTATGVMSEGIGIPTLIPIAVCEFIPSSATQAFYVTVTNGLSVRYTAAGTPGTAAAFNADLTITTGVGVTYPFTPGTAGRQFNTNCYYRIGQNPSCGVGGFASKTKVGIGCYDSPRQVHELFLGGSTIDLVNTNWTMTYQPGATGGNYLIGPGNHPYDSVLPPILGTDLLLTPPTATSSVTPAWDDGSTNKTLLFAFPYANPGSPTTTDITINSNAKIYLGMTTDPSYGSTGANSDYAISSFNGTTGAHLATVAGFMCDLDPSVAGAHIWYEDPSPNSGVRITWDNCPNWQNPAYAGLAVPCFVQMELLPNGTIYLSYGSSLGNSGSINNDANVGYSGGWYGLDAQPATPSIDWSTLNGYQSGTGLVGLKIDANARPIIGTTVTSTVSEIPPVSLVAGVIYGITGFGPAGIPLAALGMPGCQAYQTLDLLDVGVLPGTTFASAFPTPFNPALGGFQLFTQGLVLNASVPNPFQGLTSNGVHLSLAMN